MTNMRYEMQIRILYSTKKKQISLNDQAMQHSTDAAQTLDCRFGGMRLKLD